MTENEALKRLIAYLSLFEDDDLVGESKDLAGCPLARALGFSVCSIVETRVGGGVWLFTMSAYPETVGYFPKDSVVARFVRAVDEEPTVGIVAMRARQILEELTHDAAAAE